MKRRLHLVLSAIAAGAMLATGATAASGMGSARPVSHRALFEVRALNVICGVENPALSRTKVLCQGSGVPRPPNSSPNEGDPGVTLSASGKPHLVLISQNSYLSGAVPQNLRAGRTWSRRGVTCTIKRHAVTCENGQLHGFTIRNRHYRAF